jgi:transposase
MIEQQFGVRYDPSGVWHLLHGFGWSGQEPEGRANATKRPLPGGVNTTGHV